MKKIFFILTAILLINLNTDKLYAQNVPNMDDVVNVSCQDMEYISDIEFTTSYGKLTYNFKHDVASLTELGKALGIIEKGLFASGLATVGVNWEISVDTISRVISDDDICVIPVKVNVFVGYEDPMIYLSKDLKPNTCEYNVVLRHEQTHQQINKTALEYFVPKLRKAVEEIGKDIKPVKVEKLYQIDPATEDLTKNYISKVAPLVEHFKKELLKEHSKLDNRENYKQESEMCKPKS